MRTKSAFVFVSAFVILLLAVSEAWSQSVADAAREARERKGPSAAKVITNDDLDARHPVVAQTQWQRDVERVKDVLRGICADPDTDNGRNLSKDDLKVLYEAALPLYKSRLELEKKLADWKAALKRLDGEEEKAMQAAMPRQGFTEQDRDRLRRVHDDFLSQRNVIMINAQGDAEEYERLKKDLTETAAACQKAADSVK